MRWSFFYEDRSTAVLVDQSSIQGPARRTDRIVPIPTGPPTPAEWEELYASFLFRDHFVAAVSNDSPLADLETVSLEECLKEHQILPAENQRFTSRFQSLAEEMGGSYESTAVHEHAHSGFVSQGMGIAYFPEWMAKHMEYRGITFLPIEGRPLFRDMYLAAASPSAFQRLRHVFGTGSV